jgi:RNA polymerase sigma-70 factor (ECF subfamily)
MGPKPVALAADRAGPPVAAVSPRCTIESAPETPPEVTAVVGSVSPPCADTATLVFDDLYEAQLDFVWRSLLLLGVPSNVVEDAAQEVFSVVARRLDTFEGRSSVRTWLFAILQRVAANQRRTLRRKQRALEPLEEGAACRLPTPQAQLEAAESIDIVQRFCDTLDAERRAVFVLALLEQLPAPEVSLALGIPVNTVYSRVRSLREGLRRMLDGEEQIHD